MRGQRHAPTALYPRERLGTHCTGGWVGPRAGLDRCGNSHPPPGFDSRTFQPVASRYTDYTTWPTQMSIVPSYSLSSSSRKFTAVQHAGISQCTPLCQCYASTLLQILVLRPSETPVSSPVDTVVHSRGFNLRYLISRSCIK